MLRQLAVATLLAVLGWSLGAPPLGRADEPNAFARLVREAGDAYYERLKRDSPQLRLSLGLPIESLPDLSLAKEEQDAAEARAWLARLAAAKADELAHEDALSLDVLRFLLEAEADAPRFHWLRFPVTPYASPFRSVHGVFAAQAVTDAVGRARFLTLLGHYARLIGQMREILEGQAARGIRIPKQELDLVVPTLRAIAGGVDTSPLGVKSGRLAGVAPAEAEAFRSEVGRRLETQVNPGLTALASWLDGEYRKAAPDAVGLGQYPGGADYYRWLVRYHTSQDVTPEQVHRIGQERVAAIEAEMASLRARVGFTGTKAEFREKLRTDPRFFPKTADEIGARLMAHVARIEPKVDAFFLRKPRAPYGVKRLEPELEGAATFGYYQLPTASDPGGYYRYNGSKLEDRSLLNAGGLIFHELVPGHHFQLLLAIENQGLPAFRRETFFTAYSEGWGEYASDLAGEMGMYEDPYDRYGRLAMDIFISTRLVVDTGMNALGWPREKAVAFMREHLMETDTQIHTESLRYSTDIPGQSLAYRMGSLELRRLREKARAALGPRFDVRRFHDAVLGSGALPMRTLEQHVDWFVKQEQAR
ncbi:MAG: DUF885 family protein [Vicinamibacteria bacterium]